jgi:hypothetical protein
MASKKSSRRNQLTFRQKRLVHERAKGKTYAEAAIAAGYSLIQLRFISNLDYEANSRQILNSL